MKSSSIYVNGQYINSHEALERKILNPLGNEESVHLAYLKKNSTHDQEILGAAIEGARLSLEDIHSGQIDRAHAIQSFFFALELEFSKSQDELCSILSHEIKKPIRLARLEIERALGTIKLYKEYAQHINQLSEWKSSPENFHSRQRTSGISLAITPFNFPINLALHKILPALSWGCPVLWKPSPHAILSSAVLCDIIHRAKVPAGLFQFIPCDHELCSELLMNKNIFSLSFTGSDRVAWEIKKKSEARKMAFELGGNASVWVDKDQDLKKIASELSKSAFSYGGQICIAAQNIYGTQEVIQELKKELQESLHLYEAKKLQDTNSLYTCLIDDFAQEKAQKQHEQLLKNGAQLVAQAQQSSAAFPASIYEVEDLQNSFLHEECFSPQLSLTTLNSFESFLEEMKKQKNKLHLSIYTANKDQILEAEKLNFGGICVNKAPSTRHDSMPYGGEENSGIGREGPGYSDELYSSWQVKVS